MRRAPWVLKKIVTGLPVFLRTFVAKPTAIAAWSILSVVKLMKNPPARSSGERGVASATGAADASSALSSVASSVIAGAAVGSGAASSSASGADTSSTVLSSMTGSAGAHPISKKTESKRSRVRVILFFINQGLLL